MTDDIVSLEEARALRIDQERAKRLHVFDPVDWHDKPVPARRWLVDGLIPIGAVSLLTGDGGVGKSLLAMQLATCCAVGKPWLGLQTMECGSLAVYCEDTTDELHRRQFDICRHYDISLAELESVRMVSRAGMSNEVMIFPKQYGDQGQTTPLYDDIRTEAELWGARLVIIDTAADVFSGQENFRGQVRAFVGALRSIALAIDGAVLLTAHPSVAGMASGSGMSGSTAWNNSVRSRLYLTRPKGDADDEPDDNARELKGMKANYGTTGGKIRLRYEDGAFALTDRDRDTGMVAHIEAGTIEKAFLAELNAMLDERLEPSFRPESRSLYCPKLMSQRPGVKRFSQPELTRAMRSLMGRGAIVIGETDDRPSRRRRIIVPAGHRLALPQGAVAQGDAL